MTRTKLGLLSLCAVVLGLMALSATAAQAKTGAKWLILTSGGVLKEGTTLPASLNLKKDKTEAGVDIPLILDATILGIKTEFRCTELKAVNAQIFGEGTIGEKPGTVANSKVLFSGCKVFLNGVVAPECEPNDPEDKLGFVVTKPGHGLILKGAELVELLPDVGKTFATIVMSATCPIGTSIPVIGTLNLKDCKGLKNHLINHLPEEDTATSKLFVISEKAGNEARLLGSALAFLTGAHINLAWGGDPAP